MRILWGEIFSVKMHQKTPPLVSIIIVSFNTKEMTLDAIRSVFDQTKKTRFEVVVIDNASSDGSADAIKSEFSNKLKTDSFRRKPWVRSSKQCCR